MTLMAGGARLPRSVEIPTPLVGKLPGGGGPLEMLERFDWPAHGPAWRVAGCG